MASPLQSGKRSVKLGAPAPGSRIRRDPPPIAKKTALRDPDERDARIVVIGIVSFALAFFAIIIGWNSYAGSPSTSSGYTINL